MSNFSFCRTISASLPSFSRTERSNSTHGTDFTTVLAFPSSGETSPIIVFVPLSPPHPQERCELYAVGSSPEIYRLDLEQGTFMSPIPAHCAELTQIVLSPVHQMLAVGNIQGEVECYDSRSRDYLQCVKIFDSETRAIRFRDDGMQMAVGSETGVVKLFDIRSSRPLLEFEHAYETPITSLKFAGDHLLSSDRKTLRITDLHVPSSSLCEP